MPDFGLLVTYYDTTVALAALAPCNVNGTAISRMQN